MKKEKPLILLSNDDGVEAKGLNELIRGLRGVGEIIVMAPDGPRSGAAWAITSEHPVKYYKVREEEDLTVYKCTGTPVDCVKLALHTVVPRRPDVVIGGINHGDNSSHFFICPCNDCFRYGFYIIIILIIFKLESFRP